MNTLYDKIRKRLVYAKAALNPVAYRFVPVPRPDKWVFILGCYNSGTTLLHQLLALHPAIGSMPLEGRQFTDQLPLAEDYGLRRLWALDPGRFYLDENSGAAIDVSRIKRQWAFMYNDAKRPLLMEKSIINAARSRWLQRNFENSCFIILMRNGYAVAEGIRRKEGHPLEKAILQWKKSYEILFRDMSFLERKIYLTYEELTASPDETLKRLTDFLEIPALAGRAANRRFKVHGEENKIVDMNQKSFRNLTNDDFELINNLSGDLLEKTGYPLQRSRAV